MIIESVHVNNFRSILDETLYCEKMTALVGANGTGKSSFMKALDIFYSPSPKIEIEDFYNRDTTVEISIAITFKDLPEEAKELFSIYLQDNRLTVELVFAWDGTKTVSSYHGATLQNTDFQPIREGLAIKDRGKTSREAYESIREKPGYDSLPVWSILAEVDNNLRQWESEHPDRCIRERDDGQFFGFKEVGRGYLGRFTNLIFVPAIRDASEDAKEGRGSVITTLMDLVVRSVLANKEEIKGLREETQKQYQDIMDPSKLTELATLADDMTRTLQTFVPDAEIDLRWLPLSEVGIPMPQADVKLVEDGYSSSVIRTGHGLQRAFILTMFQHLALAQTISVAFKAKEEEQASDIKLPNLIMVIEEPELYQHPNRQRHLSMIFKQLTSGMTPGVAENTQIIYSTHSPLFVGIDCIDQIRLLRKVNYGENMPKITKVVSTNLDKVAETLWEASGEKGPRYTGQTVLPRLQAIMTPWMSEGFFADVAILVEGEDDRAAILGVAKATGSNLEGKGFSVIPCGGKSNIDRPYIIFKQLGIPLYIIWDGDFGKGETVGVCEKCERPLDKKADPEENRRLLRLVGRDETDWPEYIENTFACFKCDLEDSLKHEIGDELFEKHLQGCQSAFGISKRKHAIKNPNVIAEIIKKAEGDGCTCSILISIIEKIISLKD